MNFIEIAEEYIIAGLNPIPLNENKSPKLPVGHNFLYSTIDKIEMRFQNCQMIGVVCGEVSDYFYCVDFDRHQGQNIEAIYRDFLQQKFVKHLLKQNKLSLYKTKNAGYHCYFKCNIELKTKTISRYATNDIMIELRGKGSYAAVYPSSGYSYDSGCEITDIEKSEDYEIDELFNILHSYCEYTTPIVHNDKLKSSEEQNRKWPESWDKTKVEGRFNEEEGEDVAKQLLVDAGWQFVEIRKHDGVELWTRPGKSIEDGISATWGKQRKMFYVFTDAAHPFINKTAYNPFNIYTLLKYGGDWKKAKDSLKPKFEIIEDTNEEPINIEFPIEVFPDFFQEYIIELKRTLNFHPDFSAAALMFAFATLNGNKYKLKVKNGWEASTIFWFACVGYPGTIKTHPVKTFIKPLSNLDRISKQKYDKELNEFNQNDQKGVKPLFRQLLISDYTVEALHSIHSINKRGIGLYKDELKGFLNDMNKYRKGSDEEFWLESFNNGSYIVNRVTKDPILVDNISINIIGTIQHDVLNKVVTDYKGNGLIDRFLFTSAETKVYQLNDSEIDEYYFNYWTDVVNAIDSNLNYNPEVGDGSIMLTMDKETFQIYQEIDAEYCSWQNSDDYAQELKNYLSKMKTYVPRFALLLAIIDCVINDQYIEVKSKHMSDAKKVANYFINTAKNVFLRNGEQMDIKEVESGLKGLKKGEKIKALFDKGFKVADIAIFYGQTKSSIYKLIKSTKVN